MICMRPRVRSPRLSARAESAIRAKARHAVVTLRNPRGGLTVGWIVAGLRLAQAAALAALSRGWPEPGWHPPAPAWPGIGFR